MAVPRTHLSPSLDKVYDYIDAQGATIGGLGTISTQNANAVAITGGTISSTAVSGASITTSTLGGVTTNSNAAAGLVGEYITANVASGSAVALTSGATANVVSISLTAGDWDVFGVVGFLPAATTSITALSGGESATSAALGPLGTFFSFSQAADTPGAIGQVYTTPTARFSLGATTTIYLVASATFATAALSAYGLIGARRRR